jgi:hypothetical protein
MNESVNLYPAKDWNNESASGRISGMTTGSSNHVLTDDCNTETGHFSFDSPKKERRKDRVTVARFWVKRNSIRNQRRDETKDPDLHFGLLRGFQV